MKFHVVAGALKQALQGIISVMGTGVGTIIASHGQSWKYVFIFSFIIDYWIHHSVMADKLRFQRRVWR